MLSREAKLNKLVGRSIHAKKYVKKAIDPFTGEAQEDAAREGRKEILKGIDELRTRGPEARQALFDAFAGGQQARQAGLGGALDIFRASMPAQTQAFQGGNVAAQTQLLAGLPQIQNAILGRPVDFSGLQPTQLETDFSFENVQLPQTPNIAEGQTTAEQQQQQISDLQQEIQRLLAARGGNLP